MYYAKFLPHSYAISSANSNTDTKLQSYSTTTDMNNAIENHHDSTKADQSSLDTTNAIVETKASQSSLDTTNANVTALQNVVDNTIETWFYSGVPTLSNLPASEWITTELKNRHIGDLYYDNKTGYAYRFLNDGGYVWVQLSDSATAEALALSKSKKRVFISTPTIPYDIGDLWVNTSGDTKVCITAKTSAETYSSDDWVKSSNYTDDTVANMASTFAAEASGKAETAHAIAETAQETAKSATNLAEDAQETANEAISGLSDKASASDLAEVQGTVNEQAKAIEAQGEVTANVSAYMTFNSSGLYVGKSDSAIKTKMSNDAFSIVTGEIESETELAKFTQEALEVKSVKTDNQVDFFDDWAIRKGAYVEGVGYNLNDMWIGG